jgi:hypothetical protein
VPVGPIVPDAVEPLAGPTVAPADETPRAEGNGPAGPWVTGPALEDYLGGPLPEGVADIMASAATEVVRPVVDASAYPTVAELPEGLRLVVLYIAADLYRGGQTLDGTYSMDGAYPTAPAAVSSVLLRKYAAVYGPWAAVGSMVG